MFLVDECKMYTTIFFFNFRSKQCADAGLLDKNLLRRALVFYTSVAEYLLTTMTNTEPGHTPILDPLPMTAPPLFSALPEWYIEDIAEFLLFTLQLVFTIILHNF